jgi:hypothetical protein
MKTIKLIAVALILLLPVVAQGQDGYFSFTTDNSNKSYITFQPVNGTPPLHGNVWISIVPDPDPASNNGGVYSNCPQFANGTNLTTKTRVPSVMPFLQPNTIYQVYVKGGADCNNLVGLPYVRTINDAGPPQSQSIVMDDKNGNSVTIKLQDASITILQDLSVADAVSGKAKDCKSDYENAVHYEADKNRLKYRPYNNPDGGECHR